MPVRLFERRRPRDTVCAAIGSDRRPRRGRAVASRELVLGRDHLPIPAGAGELRVPLTWTDGHGLSVTKTFVLHPRLVFHRPRRTTCATTRRAAQAGLLFAVPAALGTRVALLFRRRDLLPSRGRPIYDGTKYRKLNVENDDGREVLGDHHQRLAGLAAASFRRRHRAAGRPGPTNTSCRCAATSTCCAPPVRSPRFPPGGTGTVPREAVRRPEAAGAARGHRPEPRAHRRLRQAHRAGQAAVRRCSNWVHGLIGNWGWSIIIVTALIKLLFYPLEPGERPLDGQDARRRAAHEADPGHLQGRSRETRPRDDGAVQEGEDQSPGRLPADGGADPVLHLLLLGAARERGDAPGAVHALDQRPVVARSRSSCCRC